MSTDELSPPATRPADSPARARTRLWRRPWVVPLALLTAAFVAFSLPPYLTLDPAQARLQPLPPFPGYYPLLVTHIFLGSVVLLAACLQVWPWLRKNHPRVHRTSGRIYVAAALPASVCVMVVAPMTVNGTNAQVANTILAVLWFGTTLAGFRAVRQGRYLDHRRWMLRSFALSFSIIANRLWLVALFAVFVPEIFTGAEVDTADLQQAVGVSTWISWVVNLLVVQWWLDRHPRPAELVG
jgi:uncharacterized membrane protein YozB (DUF420 family)